MKIEFIRNKIRLDEKILIISLIFSPILFYLYLIFPAEPTFDFFYIKITSTFFENVEFVFWAYFVKLNLILLLNLWFFYTKEWWRYAILPILFFTIFQLISAINDEINYLPVFQSSYFIYFFCALGPIYLALDKIINYNPMSISDKIENLTNDTLTKLVKFDRNIYSNLENELKNLRLKKTSLNPKEYLRKLMAIQTAIEKNVKTN